MTYGKLRAAYGEAGVEPLAYLASNLYTGTVLLAGISQGTGLSPTEGGFGGLYSAITKGAELEPILSDIRRKVEAFGIVVEACNTEYGPAQIEINLKYGDPLQVADDTAIFKSAVKGIARQHGVCATFMSKPFPGFSGNGTHIHLSLRD